ncbi:MAG: SCP2 sterol-binding domain-containing protein [Acidimicrobiia bacterium]|nr:SCP2 sterol-binding domain-containing protein [Acidimicrobiia bacterium]
MGVKYLTDEWAGAMESAVNADENFQSVAGGVSLSVQQNVSGGPDGDVTYHMGIKDGKAFCALGPLDGADLTINQTYETAVAIAKGELNLQNAFMQGQIQVTGNIAIAMQYQTQLASLEGAIRGVEVDY